jgi:LmbE family N-acetylglucosaminyl deacetylase
MVDWSHKERPDVFCNVPLSTAAARVADLIERYRPQVIVTYDPEGSYQHPDHVHAAQVTATAVRSSVHPARLYFKAHGTTYWQRLRSALAQVGIDRPEPTPDLARTLAAVERRITATLDLAHVVDRKRAGLRAHASQLNSSLAAQLSPELFAYAFSTESYLGADQLDAVATVDTDLFSGM